MSGPIVKLAAEGGIDIAVLRRLAIDSGLKPGDEYGLKGKDHLDGRLNGYNASALRLPWIVARDLDDDALCPGELRNKLVPHPSVLMRFRIAVRSIEAWLLADRISFAAAFELPAEKIPTSPESLVNPKISTLTVLAASRSRDTRSAMVRERPGRRLEIGPEYNVRLIEYALNPWRPNEAAKSSRSLERAIRRITDLSQAARTGSQKS